MTGIANECRLICSSLRGSGGENSKHEDQPKQLPSISPASRKSVKPGRFVAGLQGISRQAGLRGRATLKRKAYALEALRLSCRIDACAPRSGADKATANPFVPCYPW